MKLTIALMLQKIYKCDYQIIQNKLLCLSLFSVTGKLSAQRRKLILSPAPNAEELLMVRMNIFFLNAGGKSMAGHMITHSDNLIPVLHIRKMFYKKINE